jgi:Domain of unknown function (DUF4388)
LARGLLCNLDVSTGQGPILLVDAQAERLRANVAVLRHAFGPAAVRGTTDARDASAWLTYERPSVLVTCADTAESFGAALTEILRSRWGPVPVVVTRDAPSSLPRSPSDPVAVPVDPVQLRAEVARWAQPGAGAIAITLLADVLTLYARAGRTGVLDVRSPERTGSIWFDAGRPVHAVCADRVGKPAFFEVLCWNAGRFVFRNAVPPARSLEQDLRTLLAEADAVP